MEETEYEKLLHLHELELLAKILLELRAMRKQEYDYWEAWKKAKTAEQTRQDNIDTDAVSGLVDHMNRKQNPL